MFRIVLASVVVIAMQMDAAPKKGRKAAPKKKVVTQQMMPATVTAVEAKAAVEAVTDEVRQDLESATSQAAEQITAATLEKNRAILAGLEGTMPQEAVQAIVAEQDAIIAQIKLNLAQLAEKAVAAVGNAQAEASYVSQFITGAQQFGAQVWNPATEQEKGLAQAMIDRLEAVKSNTTNPAMIQKLDEQIAEQKIITGDKMSTRQLLLLGAVAAAAAVAGYTGYALTGKYFAAPATELTPEQTPTGSTLPQEPQGNNSMQQAPKDSVVKQYAKGQVKEREGFDAYEPVGNVQKNAPAQGWTRLNRFKENASKAFGGAPTGVVNLGRKAANLAREELWTKPMGDISYFGNALKEDFVPESVQAGARNLKENAQQYGSELMESLKPNGAGLEENGAAPQESYLQQLSDWWNKPAVATEAVALAPRMYTPAKATRGIESSMSQKNRENAENARMAKQARRAAMQQKATE